MAGQITKTISTHNGSKAHRGHNIRDEKAVYRQEHIDPNLSKNNEYLIDEPPQEAYRRIFGKALAEYNAKQSAPSRRIADYYRHIQGDKKKHAVYEMIIQVGDRLDTGLNAPTEKKILKKFIEDWSNRNPNLELIGAYIHADEPDGTVHAHLDYIPVADGYKNGLRTQNGLVKALGQQGFDTMKHYKETAQIRWERRENQALEDICKEHGITVKHPVRESEKKAVHQDTATYKRQQEAAGVAESVQEAYTANQRLLQENEKLEEKKKALEWDCRVAKANLKEAKSETRWAKLKKTGHGIMDTINPDYIDEEEVKQLRADSKRLEKAKNTITDLKKKLEASENRASRAESAYSRVQDKEAEIVKREKSVSQMLTEAIEGKTHNTNNRLNALESYCSDLKLKDGRSVLEAFDDRQEELKRQRNRDRGMSR